MTPLRLTPWALAVVLLGLLAPSGPAAAAELAWLPAGTQVPGDSDRPVWSVAASPAHPAVILAATQGHGVLRSTDGGSSWSTVIPGVAAAWVVRFDPARPGDAYVGTQGSGVFKTTDEGKTWAASSRGLDELDVRAIDVQDDLVLLGTRRGAYVSKDGGLSWAGFGLRDLSVAAVAILPRASGPTLFAGADNGASGGMLWRTQDLSASWSQVRGNFPTDVVVASLAVGPLPAAASERPVLVGTVQGIFRSDDAGAGWSPVPGLPPTDFNAVLFNPANADQIYVGSDGDQGGGGVYRSLDKGNTWSPLGQGLPNRPRITALGLKPTAPLTVFAASWNPGAQQVGLFSIADPSATVPGTAAGPPVAATPAARPALPGGQQPAVAPRPAPAPTGQLLWLLGAVAAGSLMFGAGVWFRHWRRRREDLRTYQ